MPSSPSSPTPLRVDPASLQTTAAAVRRLAERVRAERTGADRVVGSSAQRLGPQLQGSVRDQWAAADAGLGTVEDDVIRLGQALAVLADYFADLDRAASRRPTGELGQRRDRRPAGTAVGT